MKRNLFLACVCWMILTAPGTAQTGAGAAPDTMKVNELLAKSKEAMGTSPNLSISYSMQAKQLAEQIHFVKGTATALKNIGIVYYMQGKLLEAINYWMESLELFKQMNDQVGISNLLNNIGAIYSVQGDYQKALERYLESLKYAEQSGNKERMAAAMNNIGATYALKRESYDRALQYYLKALSLSEQINDTSGIATTSVNIGEVYSNMGNSPLALQYFNKSLAAYTSLKDDVNIPYTYNAIAKEYRKKGRYDLALQFHNKAHTTALGVDNQLYVVQSLLGLANTYAAQDQFSTSLSYYRQAERIGRDIQALNELKDVYRGLSAAYAGLHNYENAFRYQSLYTSVKDTLYNIETDKKLAKMQFDFDLQKKQGEIDLLTKNKSLRELEIQRQKLAKNALLIGLGLVFIMAFIIYRSYRIKVKTNKILDQQKAEIENLLLNMLPTEVAQELQATGRYMPRNYESVSVLFTDFKDFTTITTKLPPQDLVEELNQCFLAFDNIIEKYDLEKIKTIGDSYMCAGGISTPDSAHACKIVKAGLEIQEFIAANNQKRQAAGLDPWYVRIGIHIGPVVAGVVGKKKYAYDIWGSTVNIASRMESSGAPGKVNISAATYELVKNKYACSYRGKLYAKNVGEIDMYFVDYELDAVKVINTTKQPVENKLGEVH